LRPARQDIAAPPFPPGTDWVGGDAPRLERLVNEGPLLVHFFDFAQLNSLRALDYVLEWQRRYGELGLGVLGVHAPRLAITRPADAVAAALPRLGIEWPVAIDPEFAIWRDYGCKGWPSLFLWGKGGALRWYHLGEGEYQTTEGEVREALGDPPNGGWPEPLDPLRPGDARNAGVVPPTAEIFPGGSIETPWTADANAGPIELSYEAAGVHAAIDGDGELSVSVDGQASRQLAIDHPGLYELAAGDLHGRHDLRIEATGDLRIHSIQFAPGPPQ